MIRGLSFTSRANLPDLRDHRRRVYRTMATAEPSSACRWGLAARVTGDSDALASIFVTLAVATVASLGVIEPATLRPRGLILSAVPNP